ncbi:MAG: hypothetical protein A2Y12_01795 [Planctomycetes bacterium GWF2_42_9]|nr:MAG: hypothetical protein A2Y12_01795 [Planctomycetes bacterium GWF2_42_9]
MNKIKHNFLRTSPPKESEIMWVFMSPNRELQKIGLAAMSLRPIETERIQRTLIEFLQDPNFYFKEYAFLSLNKFKENPADKNDAVRKRLLEIIKNEEGKGKGKGNISFREFLLLAKFPSQETALFLQDQLMKEGQENKIYRIAAFSALKKMGEPYFTKVLEYVKNHSTPEMKKELLERENTWLDTSF